ncbi:PAS domain S-box protein [Methanospirillum sp. J.3.6.1-F.2.7.3]|uniref:histidine kinase n=1 Tax=Methanospirillum purgamenti TaxID=2834276 RepID=A0A8E7B3C4_9EURY|nr:MULTISPECIES: ATP-binding protein [Methanospirillum]MDX8551633.1 ATP-binding protein [Methanospirillum hungatei]QVV90326.1 PAS domain S-box protein [Methanospirillum sp. J.3.6.1-F.2.7.3]
MKPGTDSGLHISLPVLVMVVLTTIFILVTGIISVLILDQTYQHLMHEWDNDVRHNEQYLENSLKLINQGLLLFDHTFDASMKEQFGYFIEAYNQSGNDPSLMNLTLLKLQLNPSIRNIADFYIINSSGIVIDTTYPGDLGLDFKIWPAVYEDISNIRNGSVFEADRAVYGFSSAKNSRKFAYQPTPDHQYLFEISYLIGDYDAARKNFSYAQVMRTFVNDTPHIRSLTLYDSMNRILWSSDGKRTLPNSEVINFVKGSFERGNRTWISDPVNNSEVYYKFIEISDESTVSGNMLDLVARIEYDTSVREAHLNSLKLYHVLVSFIAILLGIFIAYFLANHITRPMRKIIDDINRIAHGDLCHRVSYSGSAEFTQLEVSLNLLITYLNDLITNLQEKEQYIRESKEGYQILVERLNEGIWIVDKNEITTFVNSRMAEILETTPDEIIGKHARDIIHPSNYDLFDTKMSNRHHGISERYEISLLTSKNNLIFTEISASPSLSDDGKYIGSFGVVTDISERKENEQKIRSYTLELEKRTHELEVVRDELFRINKNLDNIVHERTKEVFRLLEQKNDFIMQLGHDLRTPLTPILGLLPRLYEISGEEHDMILQIIERNARHIQNIGSKSLKLAKLNSLDYIPESENVNIADTTRTVLDINRISIRNAGITVTVHIPDNCIIRGDQILIQELIDNLISNAIKFSKPSCGTILIKADISHNIMTLTVSDTGIGLLPGEEQSIFEEFYKSDRSRHDKTSTGLGLAICKKIVQKHNGTIIVSSKGPDCGTTFTLTLPVHLENEDPRVIHKNDN